MYSEQVTQKGEVHLPPVWKHHTLCWVRSPPAAGAILYIAYLQASLNIWWDKSHANTSTWQQDPTAWGMARIRTSLPTSWGGFHFNLGQCGQRNALFSTLVSTDIASTVTRMNGRQLVLLLDDFHSRAHQLWAKCMNGLHVCPLLDTFKMGAGAFTQQIQHLKHCYKHNPHEICGCCQELFLAPFLQMNTCPWVFPLHLGWLLIQSLLGYV